MAGLLVVKLEETRVEEVRPEPVPDVRLDFNDPLSKLELNLVPVCDDLVVELVSSLELRRFWLLAHFKDDA